MNIGKRYLWLLLLTLLSTGIVAWLDQEQIGTSPIKITNPVNSGFKAPHAQWEAPVAQALMTEPTTLFRPELAASTRDIFQIEAPRSLSTQPPATAHVVPMVVPPPNIDVRFLGSFTDPTGNQTLYISQGTADIEAKVGENLSNGYVIMAADTQAIHLEHPPSGTKVSIIITSGE